MGIVLEWLHQGWDSDLSADFLHFGAGAFPFTIPLKKLQNRTFFALALATGSGFGAAISAVIVYERASLCKNYFV